MTDLIYLPVRSPTFQVLSNDKALKGAMSCHISSNNYYHCDTFQLEFAASAGKAGWWDVDPPLVVDVQIAQENDEYISLIIGEVDSVTFHIDTGIVIMEGRDLSARLIETKTQEAFVNQTSSEVASTLAARHGLKANVTKTDTLVGRYYQQDHSRVTLDQFSKTTTEWDLLTYLAQREGFDVYMTGETLNFTKRVDENSEPFTITWEPPSPVPTLNAVGMQFQRSLTLAKDVQVEVKSWNSRHERAFTRMAKASGTRAANASGRTSEGNKTQTQKYVYVRANLTEEEAQKLANQLAKDITLHERVVMVEMPGEIDLTPRKMIKITGTSTSFDQTYYIDTIDRALSFDEGFRQTLRLKNSSPRSMTQV